MLECDECGSDTNANWGDRDHILCRACSDEARAIASESVDYKAGIGVSKLVSFIGWGIVAIALIMILASFGSAGLLVALIPSFGLLTGGLLLVVAGQASRALLDNANSTRQILELMKKNS